MLISDSSDRVNHAGQHRLGVCAGQCTSVCMMHDDDYEQCGRCTSVQSVMYSHVTASVAYPRGVGASES